MNPARGSQGRHNPTQPSIFAAESLSPAYPQRAAWGTSGSLRAWQAAALKTYMTDMPEDFLAVAVRAGQVGAREVGSGEHDPGQVAAVEVGAGQVGTV